MISLYDLKPSESENGKASTVKGDKRILRKEELSASEAISNKVIQDVINIQTSTVVLVLVSTTNERSLDLFIYALLGLSSPELTNTLVGVLGQFQRIQ